MTPPLLLFLSLALLAIGTAAAMLLNRNAVYAALFLILNFSTVALLYLLLGAPFIAMAQVTVYAGAIMVLFLFVIMLLGAEKLPESQNIRWQRPLAVVIGAILLAEGVYLIALRMGAQPPLETPPANFATPADIGMVLFNQYALPFEITSVILLVAVVGAIVLTRIERRKVDPNESRPAPGDPREAGGGSPRNAGGGDPREAGGGSPREAGGGIKS